MVEFAWANERWVALPERALWWERKATLCVADVHLGKAAAFRHAGVPVPESGTDADLSRLTTLVKKFTARRMVILGDLLHAKTGWSPTMMGAFAAWREAHSKLDLLLIRGNHDARAGDPPREWMMRVEDEGFADDDDGVVRFAHDPARRLPLPHSSSAMLCGHIHPAVSMVGPAQGMRAACFWFSHRVGVLPAFGSFTGSKVVYPAAGDRVLAVGEGAVVDVSVAVKATVTVRSRAIRGIRPPRASTRA